ncbi:MAG: hypothetical protein KKC19_00355 [Nanoarchaeota archaeon]|nr:hypothetical protein [Nanoarchaeota archaeon]
MKNDDWEKAISHRFSIDSDGILSEQDYEKELIKAHMRKRNIPHFDSAERDLANQSKIFGNLETELTDLRFMTRNKYASKPLGDELQIYDELIRNAVQRFDQMKLKPKKIILPNIYLDSWLGEGYACGWKDENEVLYPSMDGVIRDFNTVSRRFIITGSQRHSVLDRWARPIVGYSHLHIMFGYKINKNEEKKKQIQERKY